MPIIRQQALHRKPVAYDYEPPVLPGGRPLLKDKTLQDYRRLDAISRRRALTSAESRRLETCIRHLDRRAAWREQKRKQRDEPKPVNIVDNRQRRSIALDQRGA